MDHSRALAHYSNMARMAAGQARWDNAAPEEDDFLDDDAMTKEEAADAARDELLATPGAVAQWLAKTTNKAHGWMPNAVDPEAHIHDLTDVQVVAMLFNGNRAQTIQARDELRQRFIKAEAAQIKERADELLKEGA